MTLEERIIKYLKKQDKFVASGEIQRLVAQKTNYTPQTAGRIMRRLAEMGKLEVDYRAKRHAWYRFKKDTTDFQDDVNWFNAL